MTELREVQFGADSLDHQTLLPEGRPAHRLKRDPKELLHADPPSVSIPGVIDAILDVGRERKLLLDQARSALLSGNDGDALVCLRRLCGLPEKTT